MSVIIGIDPGFSGAVAIYESTDKRIIHIFDMPLQETEYGKTVSPSELRFNLNIYCDERAKKLGVFEKVHSMPKQGVASTFTFGFNAGIAYAMLKNFCPNVIFAAPGSWKSAMGLSHVKQESIDLARKLFPGSEYFKTKKCDGRAEAILLCKFAERYL